jgi:hypothetical protein
MLVRNMAPGDGAMPYQAICWQRHNWHGLAFAVRLARNFAHRPSPLPATALGHKAPIRSRMPKSEYERSLRSLKVDVPADLRVQIKHEAVELDIPIRRYMRQILEERLPVEVRRKIASKAKAQNMEIVDYIVKILREAGALD